MPKKEKNEGNEWNFVAAIGGDGGTANDGGDVDVGNAGNIVTHGVNARGIVAQSVGGGGGNGGNGISGTGLDTLDQVTELLDLKDKVVFDVSNWSLIVGGTGGASGDGGDVDVVNEGSIGTTGLASTAIFAQSIGGGGGEAQNFTKGTGAGGSADTGLRGKFSIGGGGGASGDGGDVEVTNSGELITEGDDAHGIFAQSVGGGGGVAGNVDRGLKDGFGPIPPLNVGLGLAFGQDGGSGGDGGDITVTNTSNIFTRGVNSFGIFAQSVGGGGGLAGGLGNENIPILEQQNFAGSVGGDGDAGAITIDQHGDIVVLGDASDGIFAQSDTTNGFGGAVTIDVAGNIDAGGAHSNGIRTQSQGDTGSGAIGITITSGSVRGGTENGAAIAFIDGAANTLTNRGDIGRLAELDRAAVLGGAGNESIDNFGGIYGTLGLGGGVNTFTNHDDATMASGATIDLGANGTVLNEGLWSVGRGSEVSQTAMTGNFTQSASGALLLDIDHLAATADRIDAVGIASLEGSIELNQMNISAIQPGTSETVLVAAEGGIEAADLELAVVPSIVTQYELDTISDTELALTLTTTFVPQGPAGERLLPNERRVGTYINAVQLAGSSTALAPTIAGLVASTEVASLGLKYQLLNPENYAALPLVAVQSGLLFGQSLLSCKVRDGESRFTDEGECGWAAAFGSSGEQDASYAANGYRRDVRTISFGTQWEVSKRWHMGLSAAFDRDQIDSGSLGNLRTQFAEGRTLHAGMVLKGNYGGTTFAASLSAARGVYDTHRNAFLALRGSQSEQVIYQTSQQFRVSHGVEYASWYVRPMVDLGFTQVRLSAFSEHGAGSNNLVVRNAEEDFVNLRPAIEMGFETQIGSALARWYARAGLNRFIVGGRFAVEATLEGAPDDAGFLGVNQMLDRTVRECAAGVDVFTDGNVTLRVGYSGQFSSGSATHGATLKFTRSF
jgi:hypothetical protein